MILSFTLLGQFVLFKNGAPLAQFRSQKEAALLIFLAHTGKPHQREFLAELLWESSSTKQSLNNLRTVLSRLRKQVGDALLITRTTVALPQENLQQVDSVLLLDTLAKIGPIDTAEKSTALHTALESYHGAFLADFHFDNASQFNEWVMTIREQIRRQVILAFDKLGQYAQSTGDVETGIAVARRWLQVDALDESAHTLLIRLLIEAGNVSEAVAHYGHCVELLRTEMDIAPPEALTVLIKDAQMQRITSARPNTAVQHNLPPEHDQFFGRKEAKQDIHIRLDKPWCRLVTITGQGGVGKTRLATTIARSRLRQFQDGVWLVELADIDPNDDDLAEAIAVEIATILDLRLTGSATPVEQLLNHLQHKKMLLVLDNFEHLLAGVSFVFDIIQRCEDVQLLVTSREALRLKAEWVVALTGLSYPTNDADEMHSDAVELFAARRAQQQRGWILADELAAIRTICHMVEGLPLAIELAAAMTRHTTAQAVADRLHDGFDALAASLHDVPQRHSGLDIVFDMSWLTLTPALQQRLAQLSVFSGGFAATAVRQIAETDVQHLNALIEKSLLTHHAESDRYTLHPVIRAYAAEKRPATDPTPQKHAHYFLKLLAQHTEPLQKNRPQDSIDLLDPDIGNMRLAWHTGLAERQADLLYDALTSLSTYYQLRGLAREGEAVMHTTLRTATAWGDKGIPLATRAGLEQGRFLNRLGHYRPAIRILKTALKLADQGGDRWAEGMGHVWWGESLWRLGEYASAETKLNHALTIAHNIDSPLLIGWGHHQLGIIDDIQYRYDMAHDHLQQACAAWQALENTNNLSVSLNSIGIIYIHQSDFSAAQQTMEQALTLCNQLGNRHLQGLLLNNLSAISIEQGDYAGAQFYLQLGLELATTSGNLTGQGEIFTNLGKNYRLLGEIDLSVESLEKGIRIAESIENLSMMATAVLNLANTKRTLGDSAQAESLYGKALKIAREGNFQHNECEALIGLAELFNETDSVRAKQYSLQAITLAKRIGHPNLLKRVEAVNRYLSLK